MKIFTGRITPAMTAFSLEVLHDERVGLGGTEARMVDGVPLLARVETHQNGTAANPEPHPHRGVTLYTLEADEEPCPPTDPHPGGHPLEAPPARGVDASSFQRGADWAAIAASGVSFAFLKVHEGLFLDDVAAAEHYAGAGAGGLLRGAYTFFRVGVPAREQVKHFVDRAWTIGSSWELPYVLDVEAQGKAALGGASAATFEADVLEALAELAQVTGRRPLAYGSPSFLDGLPAHDWQSVAGLWVAHYGVSAPRLPHGWTSWEFWQQTDKGRVPGYPGDADVNVYRGSLEELRAAV